MGGAYGKRKGFIYEREPWKSRNTRVVPVDNYVIFYIPDKTKKLVTVIRIMYSGRDVDKFKEMRLEKAEAEKIHAPMILNSPVNIECKVKEVIPLGSHHMFLAEVTGVQVDEAYMNENGKFELNQLGLVAYSHGEYFKLGKKLGKFGYSVRKK